MGFIVLSKDTSTHRQAERKSNHSIRGHLLYLCSTIIVGKCIFIFLFFPLLPLFFLIITKLSSCKIGLLYRFCLHLFFSVINRAVNTHQCCFTQPLSACNGTIKWCGDATQCWESTGTLSSLFVPLLIGIITGLLSCTQILRSYPHFLEKLL